MSLCEDGLNARIKGGKITMMVEDTHPLIQLGNLIDWAHLAKLARADLEKTKKGFWWLGRKLKLRIHLAYMNTPSWQEEKSVQNKKRKGACIYPAYLWTIFVLALMGFALFAPYQLFVIIVTSPDSGSQRDDPCLFCHHFFSLAFLLVDSYNYQSYCMGRPKGAI